MAQSIADGAAQAGKQARQDRRALKQARADEEAAKEREQKRMEKEAARKRKAEEAKAKKDMEKEQKKQAAAQLKAKKDKEKKQAAAAKKQEGKGKQASRRRGRGADELNESDPACLLNWLAEFEAPVVEQLDDFLAGVAQGVPTVWRARRIPLRRVMEGAGTHDSKELNAACTRLHAEKMAFISEFAQVCEAEPDRIKKTKPCSEDLQEHTEALSMDNLVAGFLEKQAVNRTLDIPPCMVMERAHVEDYFSKVREELEAKYPDSPELQKNCDAEGSGRSKLNLIGMQRGKWFAGVIGGLYPHLSYQLQGTRAVALASIRDVTWIFTTTTTI